MELSERLIAIAGGNDPDDVAPEPEYEQRQEQEVPDETAVSDDADEQSTGEVENEGKEAESPQGPQSGKEAATSTDQNAEKVVEQAGTSDWLDDDSRQLGTSYGLTDEHLKNFSSAEEFRRATIIFELSKKAKAKAEEAVTTESTAEAVKPAEVKAEAKEPELDPDKYREAGYDEETVKLVKTLKEEREARLQSEGRISRMEKYFEEQERIEKVNAFHDATDSLDAERYGRSTDDKGEVQALKPEHDANRKRLFESFKTVLAGLSEQAKETGVAPKVTFKALVKRAENLEFGEELLKAEREKLQKELMAQSARRRPVGNRRATPAVVSAKQEEVDPVQNILNDPDVRKFLDDAKAENGR
jgi:hypothetical protein